LARRRVWQDGAGDGERRDQTTHPEGRRQREGDRIMVGVCAEAVTAFRSGAMRWNLSRAIGSKRP